ncbi:phosphotransferase [Geobacter sp.]|uniref:phosphotransferase n=1 Tax=Geobacter sp. TaxID=46610 RepID=UPI0026283FA1|nr:phosphotransferase [Geobacter sp.]
MLLEMHCHTAEFSACSSVAACDLVRRVYAKGLQGIVFTDHHYLWSEEALRQVRRAAEVPEHFLILSGQEVDSAECGDVLVYGATRVFPPRTSLVEIREEFPAAALVWAHPYRKGRRPSAEALRNQLLDGIEIFNSNHTVLENSRALRDWHQQRFTAIGGTDTHGGSYAGLYPTIFDHPVRHIFDLAAEIRHGRCRPFLKEIPRSGANSLVTEVTIGTKGIDEVRERLIIKEISSSHKWRSEERAHQIMALLVRHGFGDGAYRVPRPIDEDTGTMTLIEQGLRAKSLFDKLLTSDVADGRDYLERSATWLAKMHNCHLRITAPDEFLAKEEIRLAKYLERFTEISHRHLRKVSDLIHALREAERRVVRSYADLMVQGHGDFHPKNIFVGQDSQENRSTLFVAAIDFESSLVLPRAFDVGCFLAQFRNQFFAHPEIMQKYPEQIFLDSYLRGAGNVEPDFLRQVELFRARTNMSIAAYLIKVGMGESEDLWRVIVEAEQALAHV